MQRLPQATSPRRRFTVTLESDADVDDFSGFRRWLKTAWRAYSLRVIEMQTSPALPPIAPPPETATPAPSAPTKPH